METIWQMQGGRKRMNPAHRFASDMEDTYIPNLQIGNLILLQGSLHVYSQLPRFGIIVIGEGKKCGKN